MTQIYIKLINHSNDYSNKWAAFWSLKYNNSNITTYQFSNNYWYDLNQIIKDAGKNLSDYSDLKNIQTLYMFQGANIGDYTLPPLTFSYYSNKEDADKGTNYFKKYVICNNTTEKDMYGHIISLSNGSIDLTKDQTIYCRYDVADYTLKQATHNWPIICLTKNAYNSFSLSTPSYTSTKEPYVVLYKPDSQINLTYNGTNSQTYEITTNDKKQTQTFNNKNTFNTSLAENDVLTFVETNKPEEKVTITYDPTINCQGFWNNVEPGQDITFRVQPNLGSLVDFTQTKVLYFNNPANVDDNSKASGSFEFNEDELHVDTRKDGTKCYSAYLTIASKSGTYKLIAVAKKTFIKIDNKLQHATLISADNNSALTQIPIDQINKVKFNISDNYTLSDVTLTGGMYLHKFLDLKSVDPTQTYEIPAIYSSNDYGFNVIYGIDTLELNGTETQKQETQYTSIVFKGQNATLNLNKIPFNQSAKLVATTNENYIFRTNSTNENLALVFWDVTPDFTNKHYFTFDDKTKTSAHYDFSGSTNSIIYVSCETEPTENTRKQVPIKLTLTNCLSSVSTLPENTDTMDFISKEVTLTANDNYLFKTDIVFYSYNSSDKSYTKHTLEPTNTNTITFKIAAGPYSKYNETNCPVIVATADLKQTEKQGLDSIHLYKMNNKELDETSNQLINMFANNGGLAKYDYTQYINQVYKIPFEIPNSMLEPTTKVKVGNQSLAINTTQINDTQYNINVGSITVKGNNATDYSAFKTTLILPFITNQNLNINDVMNNTLTITYRINVLNGTITVVIDNDSGNLVTTNYVVATQLQLFGAYYDKNVNTLNSVLNNQIRQAYLVISYKEPVLNLKTYSTNEHGVLKSYKGLTKAINPAISFTCNNSEYSAIVAQLESGVIIK